MSTAATRSYGICSLHITLIKLTSELKAARSLRRLRRREIETEKEEDMVMEKEDETNAGKL